jgi:iron complex transport system substrate-binding protein
MKFLLPAGITCILLIMAAVPVSAETGGAPGIAGTSTGWQPVTVTDDFGTTVTIDTEPRRIVSLAPANTEILFALGLGDRVVGVTDFCNYPAEAAEKPKMGGYATVNIEQVITAQPDLIVAAYGNTEETIGRMRELGLTVVALNPDSVNDTLRDIRLVGTVTGAEKEAASLAGNIEDRIETIREKMTDATERPEVVHVMWYEPVWVSGNNTFQDEMIRLAGGENAFSDVDGWQVVDVERIITTDPDVILVNSGTGMGGEGEDLIYRSFMKEQRFQNLKAVKEGRVHIVDSDIMDRGGPRIADALEDVAADVHPECFPAPGTATTTAPSTPGFGAVAGAAALVGACTLLRRHN